MTLLLDTHAFLWFISEDARLSVRAREAIAHPDHDAFCSDVVAWEIAIKSSLGRLQVPAPLDAWYRAQLESNRLERLPISLEAITGVRTLAWHHRDPFDRLLAATALVEDLVLVSRDEAFDAYGVRRVW